MREHCQKGWEWEEQEPGDLGFILLPASHIMAKQPPFHASM